MVLSVKTRISSLLCPVADRRWLGGDGSVVRTANDQMVARIFRGRADSILCPERGDPGAGHGADEDIIPAKKILPCAPATHDLCCRGKKYFEPTMRICLDPLAIIFIPDQNHSYLVHCPAEMTSPLLVPIWARFGPDLEQRKSCPQAFDDYLLFLRKNTVDRNQN